MRIRCYSRTVETRNFLQNGCDVVCYTAANGETAIVMAQQIKGNEIVWIKLQKDTNCFLCTDTKGTISFDLSGF